MELNHLGYNILTLGFVGTTVFTLICTWGLWQQNKIIWTKQSGESISVIWFSYSATGYAVGFIYGLFTNSIALMLNGLLIGLMHLPVLLGIWRYKGFSNLEKILGIILIMIIMAMILTPYDKWFFLIITLFGALIALNQPYEIWRAKSPGVVSIKLLIIYATNSSFWMIYSYTVNDLMLKIVNPAFLSATIFTIIVWYIYYKKGLKKVKLKEL